MLTKYVSVVIPSRRGRDHDQSNMRKDFGGENAVSVVQLCFLCFIVKYNIFKVTA